MESLSLLIVGLTGGIGSGKSSFCSAFANLGVPVIDADAVGHQLSSPNSEANQHVVERFGSIAVLDDGSLNRAWLREVIFNDAQLKIALEEIFHPLILLKVKTQIQQLSKEHPYCILAVPLLFEKKSFLELTNITLAIDCSENDQISRVMRRNSLTKNQVKKIIESQMSRATRNELADIVIDNSEAPENIVFKVSQLNNFLLEKS